MQESGILQFGKAGCQAIFAMLKNEVSPKFRFLCIYLFEFFVASCPSGGHKGLFSQPLFYVGQVLENINEWQMPNNQKENFSPSHSGPKTPNICVCFSCVKTRVGGLYLSSIRRGFSIQSSTNSDQIFRGRRIALFRRASRLKEH